MRSSRGKDGGPWQDGRRAWERLNGWHQDNPAARPGHPDDGAHAVEALADIGVARHLLDQAELIAVRTARRHGKSWSEIAVKLGVSRQSAWERWRELDDAEPTQPVQATSLRSTAVASADDAIVAAANEVLSRNPRQLRRRASCVVPNVVGYRCDVAHRLVAKAGLVAVGPDQDEPPLIAVGRRVPNVKDQSPEGGAKVPPGSPVTLWLDTGGSAGVREPRRPAPTPISAREMRYEQSDEAAG